MSSPCPFAGTPRSGAALLVYHLFEGLSRGNSIFFEKLFDLFPVIPDGNACPPRDSYFSALRRKSQYLFSIFFKKNQKYLRFPQFSLSIRHPHSCLPPTNSHRTTLLTNPDSFPSVLPTPHAHADPPPSGSRPLSTPHAHADPPPGGSRRFTPVPTVRPRAASYLRCSGHEAARSRPRSSVFTSTPSESRSAHTDYLRSFSAKYPRV